MNPAIPPVGFIFFKLSLFDIFIPALEIVPIANPHYYFIRDVAYINRPSIYPCSIAQNYCINQ